MSSKEAFSRLAMKIGQTLGASVLLMSHTTAFAGSLSAGYSHSCHVVDTKLECWGGNSSGQLGLGTVQSSSLAQQISELDGVTAVSAGGSHTCAIQQQGLKCWGNDLSGQVGDGGANNLRLSSSNFLPDFATGVQQVDAGAFHTCAIKQHALFCWGSDSSSQLGNGPTAFDASTPKPVPATEVGVTQVSAGTYSTCAIQGGGLTCWGKDYDGLLGNGPSSTAAVESPNGAVPGLEISVSDVAVGENHACAIQAGGARCWGWDGKGQLGNGGEGSLDSPSAFLIGLESGVTAITAGTSHTCAIKDDKLYCWGSNETGQLGSDFSVTVAQVPTEVDLPADVVSVNEVAAGNAHTCATATFLDQSVRTMCWGDVGRGAVGQGRVAIQLYPQRVGPGDITSISAGGQHSCAAQRIEGSILTVGAIYCWGDNRQGQVGVDNAAQIFSTPTQVNSLGILSGDDAENLQVSAGRFFSCALRDHEAVCWGSDDDGALGNGAGGDGFNPSPVVGIGTSVQSLDAGEAHACAVYDYSGVEGPARGLRCWGDDFYGQIGNNTALADMQSASPVSGFSKDVESVSAGRRHTCAIKSGGAFCWGYGLDGQLGNSAFANSATPLAVVGLQTGVTSIAAGLKHSCAVQGGSVWCWGSNNLSNLGLGDDVNSSAVPLQVPGLANATSVSASDEHTCAVTSVGDVFCWGRNYQGQLGIGHDEYIEGPQAVDLPAPAMEVSAGYEHSCAILVDSTMWCWGDRHHGRLGDGETGFQFTVGPPVQAKNIFGSGFEDIP